LIPFISKYDEVIGARLKGRKNITRLNRFGNWAINTYFNIIFDSKLTDVCSGMYLLKTEYAKSLKLVTEGFDVEVEIAAHAARNQSIFETPISFFSRIGHQKLRPVRDGIKIISTITNLAIRLQFMRFISLAAACLFFPSIVLLSFPFIFNFLEYELSSYFIGMLFLVLSLQGTILLFIDSRFLKK
jgi:dolichol-phosphate mannosyltransferase